jgi:hypothetical protein
VVRAFLFFQIKARSVIVWILLRLKLIDYRFHLSFIINYILTVDNMIVTFQHIDAITTRHKTPPTQRRR